MIKTSNVDIEHCTFPGGYSPFETRGDCTFDEHAANVAIEFFPRFLVHVKGKLAGQPLELAQWQKDIIGTLFGWKRPDGTRRYRTAYIEVPRKAGKSTMGAGIALFSLYMDKEPGAEVYSCAAETKQASIVFKIAKEMVQRNEVLEPRSKIYQKSIAVTDTKTGIISGTYEALSSDAHTKHGYNPSCVIFDELHAQPNPDLWEVMETGMGARTQPLMVAITTAGFDRNSICYHQHRRARSIIEGVIDDETFLPVIYGADDEDDWTSEEIWIKAQPNLGVSVPIDFYQTKCKAAQDSPLFENTFRRLYLDQWTEQDVRWLAMIKWDACSGSGDAIAWRSEQLNRLKGKECYGGLDMSTTTDITAFVLVFKEDEGYTALPFFWIPEEGARNRSHRDRVDYDVWARQGFLKTTSGLPTIDYDVVRSDIVELGKQYNIKEIPTDRWNATQIITQLDGDGFNIYAFGQGYASMSSPSKMLEKIVLDGTLDHGGNPVLRWMASNVTVEQDAAGNIKPSKKKSTERIDGIVSLVMGLDRASTQESVSVGFLV